MVYLSFVILFEIGSLICGTARSSSMFIAGRAIAGLGGSGLINGGMTILAGAVPLEKSAGKLNLPRRLRSIMYLDWKLTFVDSLPGDFVWMYVWMLMCLWVIRRC